MQMWGTPKSCFNMFSHLQTFVLMFDGFYIQHNNKLLLMNISCRFFCTENFNKKVIQHALYKIEKASRQNVKAFRYDLLLYLLIETFMVMFRHSEYLVKRKRSWLK